MSVTRYTYGLRSGFTTQDTDRTLTSPRGQTRTPRGTPGQRKKTEHHGARMCHDVWEEADGSQRVRSFILLQPGPTAPLTERG